MMTHALAGELCAWISAAGRNRFRGPTGTAAGGAKPYASCERALIVSADRQNKPAVPASVNSGWSPLTPSATTASSPPPHLHIAPRLDKPRPGAAAGDEWAARAMKKGGKRPAAGEKKLLARGGMVRFSKKKWAFR